MSKKILSREIHKMTWNFVWMSLDRCVQLIFQLIVSVAIINHLGPERFGTLSYCISIAYLVSSVAVFGLDELVVRELVWRREDHRNILVQAFMLRCALAIISSLMLLGIAALSATHDSAASQVLIIFALLPEVKAIETFALWFRSNLKMRPIVVLRSVALTLGGLARLAAVHLDYGLTVFAALTVAEQGFVAVGSYVLYASEPGQTRPSGLSLAQLRELVRAGFHLWLASMVTIVYLQIDVVMLKLLHGAEEAGIFASASRLSEVVFFLPVAITSSVAPAITAAQRRDPLLARRYLIATFQGLILSGLAVAAALALASPLIYDVLFDDRFARGTQIFQIHVWSLVFVGLSLGSSIWLINNRRNDIVLWRSLLGTLVCIVLNLALIPPFGALGAATGTLFAHAATSLLAALPFADYRRGVAMAQLDALSPAQLARSFRLAASTLGIR